MLAGCLPQASQTPHPQRRGGHQTSHQRMLPMHSSSQTLSHGGPSRLEDPRLTRGVAKNEECDVPIVNKSGKIDVGANGSPGFVRSTDVADYFGNLTVFNPEHF